MNGRPPDYKGQPKERTQITLTPTARALIGSADNPVKQAGWKSLSEFNESALRGEIEVPSASSRVKSDA